MKFTTFATLLFVAGSDAFAPSTNNVRSTGEYVGFWSSMKFIGVACWMIKGHCYKLICEGGNAGRRTMRTRGTEMQWCWKFNSHYPEWLWREMNLWTFIWVSQNHVLKLWWLACYKLLVIPFPLMLYSIQLIICEPDSHVISSYLPYHHSS